MKKMIGFLFVVLFGLAAISCGGGGGGGGETPSATVKPFKVEDTYPKDGATDVATNVVISVKMTRELGQVRKGKVIAYQGAKVVDGIINFDTVDSYKFNFAASARYAVNTTTVVFISDFEDKAGNIMEAKVISFTTGGATDTTPPTVESTTPANGAEVLPDSEISAILSELVDSTSVNINTFGVKNISTGVNISAAACITDADKAKFEPVANLPSGNYEATLSGIKDLSGNVMTESYSWKFTVLDTTPPTILSVTPVDGTVVSKDALKGAKFSTQMDPNFGKVWVYDGGTALPVTKTVTGDMLSITATLDDGKSYRVILEDFRDLAGKVMAAPYTWTFSTSPGYSTTLMLPLSSAVFYSAGGSTQATFDNASGTVAVKIVADPMVPTQVSIRWAPIPLVKDRPVHITFDCTSTPANLNIEVQLKRNGGDYHAYDTEVAVCKSPVDLVLVPDGDDPVGRLNINFASSVGVFVVGPVTIQY